ncbi:HAD family hydrolase [Pelagibius sp. Alg239-R121]|uniref:HAD family hydrolase n=1 Tax=Pelagibius sp. Alg239-R121 TaxID=2993448 RepID=UPI0024A73D9A|nr:HAD family hydrolase [Pelagibius sp. Alg239-R121]
MIAAVLFDLDETLFARTLSLQRFLEDQLGKQYPDIFSNLENTVSRFLELDNRGMKPKDEVYQALLAEIGRNDQELVVELFDHYERNAWRFASGFDGVSDALNEIRELGAKIGIVTNGQTHIQLRSLLALNLDRMADEYVISEAVGLRKPDPKIFHLAAERLSVRVEDCVFIGDSPTADIVGAKQVGMKTIWFPNGAVWPHDLSVRADSEIRSLSELSAALHILA